MLFQDIKRPINDHIEAETRRQIYAAGEVLENRIRSGCSRCGGALMTVDLKPLPGARVIYRPWWECKIGETDGFPYCGQCLHQMGICCEPGDDYEI